MNEFNNIGKQMPYRESEDYIDRLVAQATDNALGQVKQHARRRLVMMVTSSAATVLLIIGVALAATHVRHQQVVASTARQESPIDEFLGSLTDEEVTMLPCYEIEEIPEY